MKLPVSRPNMRDAEWPPPEKPQVRRERINQWFNSVPTSARNGVKIHIEFEELPVLPLTVGNGAGGIRRARIVALRAWPAEGR